MSNVDARWPLPNAIQRSITWLTAYQNDDGSYGDRTIGLEGYYKSPLAFAEVGLQPSGAKSLEWIISEYGSPEGHFHDHPVAMRVDRHCDLYEDFWITWGAIHLGKAEVAAKTLSFALRFFNHDTGGFQSKVDTSGNGLTDLRSTALGGLTLLAAAKLEEAYAAVRFVLDLLRLQPNPHQYFLLMRDSVGNIITDFPPPLERFFVVSPKQQRPIYYALGFAVAFLAKIFDESRDHEHRAAAEHYLDVCKAFGEHILLHDYAGKLAWGLALLYRQTGREEYLDLVQRIVDYLIGLQQPNGEWWLRPLYPLRSRQPAAITLDRTAEYAFWLACIDRELNVRGGAP